MNFAVKSISISCLSFGLFWCYFCSDYAFGFAEENEKPADLSQRIVFKSKKSDSEVATSSEDKSEKKDKKRSARPDISKSKLSFQVEDDDEGGDDNDEDSNE